MLQQTYPNRVRHYDAPDLTDLPQNRALAHKYSRYKWIFRGDADYIAYSEEDGDASIRNLREDVLLHGPQRRIAYAFLQRNLFYDWNQTGRPFEERHRRAYLNTHTGKYVFPPVSSVYETRLYRHTSSLKFSRLGRTEGVSNLNQYERRRVDRIYWVHVTLREDYDLFMRSLRTDWRELGDFVTYPTLERYLYDHVLPNVYKCSLPEAVGRYVDSNIKPVLMPYDEGAFGPLPLRIKRRQVAAGDST